MFPYHRYPSTEDSEYLRALAEERAAHEQYVTARRAQEEARQRAARARAARRSYASPYSSFHVEDDFKDMDVDTGLGDSAYFPQSRPYTFVEGQRPFGYGLDSYQQRALMEEQRRRELLDEQKKRELLELERAKQRRWMEEERIRRILEEEKQREEAARQRMLEEEQMRKAVEEEKLRRALREEEARKGRDRAQLRAQQAALEPIFRVLGFVPATSDVEEERPGRLPRPTGMRRAGTTPSPIRPYPFGQVPPMPGTQPPAERHPGQKAAPTPPTTVPVPSPKPSARPAPEQPTPRTAGPAEHPTAEQVEAAEKIQHAYLRRKAFDSIEHIRQRFITAKKIFPLPTTIDYDITLDSQNPIEVTVDLDATAELENTIPTENAPKLAYTRRNAQLHAYEEELNKFLIDLDEVASQGDTQIRAARRELAREIQNEAERLERWRCSVWQWWVKKRQEETGVSPVPATAVLEAGPEQPAEPAETAKTEEQMEVEPSPFVEAQPCEEGDVSSTAAQASVPSVPEETPASHMSREGVDADVPTTTDLPPTASTTAHVAAVQDSAAPNVDISGDKANVEPSAPVAVPQPEQAPKQLAEEQMFPPPPPPPTPSPTSFFAAIRDPNAPRHDVEGVRVVVRPPSHGAGDVPAADSDISPQEQPQQKQEPTPASPITAYVAAVQDPRRPAVDMAGVKAVVEPPLDEGAAQAPASPEVDAARPATPALSHVGTEVEVEPEEVHTPPPGAHTPLAVFEGDTLEPASEGMPPTQPGIDADKRKTSDVSPLVDQDPRAFARHDML